MVTAIVVPLLVVLVVLARVHGDGDESPVSVSGPTASERADLPTLDVDVPPPTAANDAACPALMTNLPLELAGEQSRRVRSETPYAYAWGDPAVVLRCGVDRPAGFVAGGPQPIQLDDVLWFVDDSDPGQVVWTAVNRAVYIEVTVPGDSEPVIALSALVSKYVAGQEPQPGP